jgi:hypothetical protein
MRTPFPTKTETAIWGRLLQPAGKSLSLQAAHSILGLDFTAADKERIHHLTAKARDGTLTADEQEEIRSYERVGNLLALMKSKALQRLKRAPGSNGSAR